MEIEEWISQVIDGSGGFKVWEDSEWVIHHKSREYSIAAWVIRCLANPKCEGSKQVLRSINRHRKEVKMEKNKL